MIFLGEARQGIARLGVARPGMARQHVTWYGNQDNFQGRAWLGTARHGLARCGTAWQREAKRLPVGGITGHFR